MLQSMFSLGDDVLKATMSTLKIFQNSNIRGKKHATTDNDFINVLDSSESCEEVFSSIDSRHSESIEFENNVIDSKYADTVEKINTVDRMYRNLEKNWQTKDVSDIETYFTEYYADIIEPSRIRKTIENMKSVIPHIQTIDEKRSKLKQVLRCDVSNDVWLIKKDYHKAVVNFFNLVSEILKKIDFLMGVFENRKTFNPDTLTMLQKKEQKVIQVLHENMDSMEALSNVLKNHSYSRNL